MLPITQYHIMCHITGTDSYNFVGKNSMIQLEKTYSGVFKCLENGLIMRENQSSNGEDYRTDSDRDFERPNYLNIC